MFYVFHLSKVERQSTTYNYAKKVFHELDIAPKYLRKFTATKMLELGIPGEIVDFIEGRTPGNILTKHYLDLLTLAKKYYPYTRNGLDKLALFNPAIPRYLQPPPAYKTHPFKSTIV